MIKLKWTMQQSSSAWYHRSWRILWKLYHGIRTKMKSFIPTTIMVCGCKNHLKFITMIELCSVVFSLLFFVLNTLAYGFSIWILLNHTYKQIPCYTRIVGRIFHWNKIKVYTYLFRKMKLDAFGLNSSPTLWPVRTKIYLRRLCAEISVHASNKRG